MDKLSYILICALLSAALVAGCSSMSSLPFMHSADSGNPDVQQSNGVASAYGVEPLAPPPMPPTAKQSAGLGELHYAVESEEMARSAQCNSEPTARLLAKGPGYETYVVPCRNDEIMTIRCDFSVCRTVR